MHVIITVGGRRREQHDLATATRENQALQRARGLVWVDGRSYSHSLSLWGVHQADLARGGVLGRRRLLQLLDGGGGGGPPGGRLVAELLDDGLECAP